MLKDAIGAYIASLIEDKEPVPQDSGYETLETIALPSISPAPSYV